MHCSNVWVLQTMIPCTSAQLSDDIDSACSLLLVDWPCRQLIIYSVHTLIVQWHLTYFALLCGEFQRSCDRCPVLKKILNFCIRFERLLECPRASKGTHWWRHALLMLVVGWANHCFESSSLHDYPPQSPCTGFCLQYLSALLQLSQQ